jgi:hypothetical protein
MKRVIDWLSGRKTFIGIVLGAVYSVLISVGVLESDEIVWTILLAWTGISFRLAVKK